MFVSGRKVSRRWRQSDLQAAWGISAKKKVAVSMNMPLLQHSWYEEEKSYLQFRTYQWCSFEYLNELQHFLTKWEPKALGAISHTVMICIISYRTMHSVPSVPCSVHTFTELTFHELKLISLSSMHVGATARDAMTSHQLLRPHFVDLIKFFTWLTYDCGWLRKLSQW